MAEIIKFGKFPQLNPGIIEEPAEWLVLEKKGNEALLISRYGLDCYHFHTKPFIEEEMEYDITPWEESDLRKWLNSVLLKSLFTPEEQERILLSEVVDEEFFGGKIVLDWLFCLSYWEAKRYLKDNAERKCRPAVIARSMGEEHWRNADSCPWWLRTLDMPEKPYMPMRAAAVNADGSCDYVRTDHDFIAVRPAMRIKL